MSKDSSKSTDILQKVVNEEIKKRYSKQVIEHLFQPKNFERMTDADCGRVFNEINKPMQAIKFDAVLKGIKEFREIYKGKFALQIMFTEKNENLAKNIARIAVAINPDEVQINTPLRPCGIRPLSKQKIDKIMGYFADLKAISVYSGKKVKVEPISTNETLKRRGKI